LNDSDIMADSMSDTTFALPGPALGSTVRAFLWRETSDDPASQLNRFPAAPFCTITWCIAGRLHLGESAEGPLLDPVIVAGPFTRPILTFASGRLRAFTIVFFPDAFARLTGLSPAVLADHLVPARSVLPAGWAAFLDDIAHAADDHARMQHAERFLLARGDADHAGEATPRSWLQQLRHRLDTGALCERQVERRIKQQTGQSLRALRGAERFEAAVLNARSAAANGTLSWASVATESGYADQPHICREFRKRSGKSPASLVGRAEADESDWIYRYWE
jgi:AraC-like DNA-binding protein